MTKKSPKVWRYHLQRHWLPAPPEQPRSRYGGLGPTWPQFLRGHFRTGDDDENVDIDGQIMLSLVCSPRVKYLVDSGQESVQYFCAEISNGLIFLAKCHPDVMHWGRPDICWLCEFLADIWRGGGHAQDPCQEGVSQGGKEGGWPWWWGGGKAK